MMSVSGLAGEDAGQVGVPAVGGNDHRERSVAGVGDVAPGDEFLRPHQPVHEGAPADGAGGLEGVEAGDVGEDHNAFPRGGDQPQTPVVIRKKTKEFKMNKNQKIVVIAVGIIMLVMLLFPPFEVISSHGTFNRGYSFILEPPDHRSCVNIGLLLMQWIVIIVCGAIGWFLLKEEK